MTRHLRERIIGTTNAATAVDISIPQIKPGQSALITHLALANASGEIVDVAFGITSLGVFDQFWAVLSAATGDAIGVHVILKLLEGDKLTARVTGTANHGPVTFIVSGTLSDETPEVVEVVTGP